MKKIIMASITAVAVITVLAGALIPILDDATADSDTYTNDGYFRLSKITTSSEDVTILWDHTKPLVFSVNGDDVTLPAANTTAPIFPYSIISTDTWCLRATVANNGAKVTLNVYENNYGLLWNVATTDNLDASVTISAGYATIQKGTSSPTSLSFTSAFIPDNNGIYTMKKGNVNAYLKEDSEIYSTGVTTAKFGGSNVTLNMNVQGTIENGATATVLYPPTGYTTSNVTVNKTADSEHEDLYSFSNVTFTVTDTNTNTANATYGQVIVPYQVSADRVVQFTDGEKAIFGVIPVFVIVALLVAIVALVIRNREM